VPVAAISCHGLPSRSPHEVPTLVQSCGIKRRLFGAIERLPSKRSGAYYRHDGRRAYAQGTFATKADATAWLANTETYLGRGTWLDRRRGQGPSSSTPAPV
jgi:hypothetical protein